MFICPYCEIIFVMDEGNLNGKICSFFILDFFFKGSDFNPERNYDIYILEYM